VEQRLVRNLLRTCCISSSKEYVTVEQRLATNLLHIIEQGAVARHSRTISSPRQFAHLGLILKLLTDSPRTHTNVTQRLTWGSY